MREGTKRWQHQTEDDFLYSIQLLFRLDGINFKKRFKKKILSKNKFIPSSMQRLCELYNFSLWNKVHGYVQDTLRLAIFNLKEIVSRKKNGGSTKRPIGQTTDSMCRYIQIRLIIPLESRKHAPGANIVRRIPDVIHYSAEIWRSGKSRDFHRRARRRGAQHTPPSATHRFHVGRVAIFPLLHDPKISSRSHGEIEKLTLLFAEKLPPTPSKDASCSPDSYSISSIRRCHDSDEYSLEGFITSIYMHGSVTHIRTIPPAQSNLRTYIRRLFRGFWPANFLQRRAGEVAAPFNFAMLHLITLYS